MRLHPAVSKEEVLQWLRSQVPAEQQPNNLEEVLQQYAAAMAAVSAVVLPDDLEPRFP